MVSQLHVRPGHRHAWRSSPSIDEDEETGNVNDFETLCSKHSCRRFTNPKSATYSSSSVDGTALKYTPSLLDFCTGLPPTVQVSRSPGRSGLKPLGKWPHVLKQISRGRESSTCTIHITVDTADSRGSANTILPGSQS